MLEADTEIFIKHAREHKGKQKINARNGCGACWRWWKIRHTRIKRKKPASTSKPLLLLSFSFTCIHYVYVVSFHLSVSIMCVVSFRLCVSIKGYFPIIQIQISVVEVHTAIFTRDAREHKGRQKINAKNGCGACWRWCWIRHT